MLRRTDGLKNITGILIKESYHARKAWASLHAMKCFLSQISSFCFQEMYGSIMIFTKMIKSSDKS